MLEIILHFIGFFIITILIQSSLAKINCRVSIWQGSNAVIAICALGIVFQNIHYFAAIIGFSIANEIGKNAGWHK